MLIILTKDTFKKSVEEVKAVRLSQDKRYQILLAQRRYFKEALERTDKRIKQMEDD